ncbi:hypothetical protein CC78DRAFT_580008 [Lojkania enalia]|uniref:Uncharacterized protein n=1 Tax=Lojkania enalia TaxID=147567 RepID=A0A9P4K9V9_9PLEO|nr:hypothetical protein CC78DRAFT_580008 [Didymosphaeria enalia]
MDALSTVARDLTCVWVKARSETLGQCVKSGSILRNMGSIDGVRLPRRLSFRIRIILSQVVDVVHAIRAAGHAILRTAPDATRWSCHPLFARLADLSSRDSRGTNSSLLDDGLSKTNHLRGRQLLGSGWGSIRTPPTLTAPCNAMAG